MTAQTQNLTVRKSVAVRCAPEEAFELFTARLATWWPFETHSTTDERPEAVGLASGEEHEWATVLAWEPPERFVIDWHVSSGKPSTELEVRFVSEGDGTRVELEHRGWERYGNEAAESYESYNGGWDTVLGRYVAKANA